MIFELEISRKWDGSFSGDATITAFMEKSGYAFTGSAAGFGQRDLTYASDKELSKKEIQIMKKELIKTCNDPSISITQFEFEDD